MQDVQLSALTVFVFATNATAVVAALAMLVLVLWQSWRDADNQLMAAYFLVIVFWSGSIFTGRFLALVGADPQVFFYNTFLGGALNALVLSAVVSHYAGLWSRRWVLALLGAGIVITSGVFAPLLYRGWLLTFIAYAADGRMHYQLHPLGYVTFATTYLLAHVATLACVWVFRHGRAGNLLSGAIVATAGSISHLLPSLRPYPLPAIGAAVSSVLFARAILREQLFNPMGELNRELGVVNEQLSERNPRLQEAIAKREELIEELDAFAQTVAHDQKGPLATIIGYAQILQEANLPAPECQELEDGIIRNAVTINTIIGALLLLAGVRQAEAAREPLDMSRIVASVQSRLADMRETYGATIVFPSTWPVAVGYVPWVEEVWVNYLSNAIKYGGDPPRVELGATAGMDGMPRFWIRDNGRGLTPEQQAQLFMPFTRLGHSKDGHGLGLSIVQRIVTKLGGQVGVESSGVPGEGSIFSFTLPAAQRSRG